MIIETFNKVLYISLGFVVGIPYGILVAEFRLRALPIWINIVFLIMAFLGFILLLILFGGKNKWTKKDS